MNFALDIPDQCEIPNLQGIEDVHEVRENKL